jgi:hypothetical protein
MNLWKSIRSALSPGGRFAGHFFGRKDGWSSRSEMTFLDHSEVLKLFEGFDIEHLEETLDNKRLVRGGEKICHIFQVVARKA